LLLRQTFGTTAFADSNTEGAGWVDLWTRSHAPKTAQLSDNEHLPEEGILCLFFRHLHMLYSHRAAAILLTVLSQRLL